MNQQQSDRERGATRKSERFSLDRNVLQNFGRRTGAYIGDNNRHKTQGLARWSNYIIDDDEDNYTISKYEDSYSDDIPKVSELDYSDSELSKLTAVPEDRAPKQQNHHERQQLGQAGLANQIQTPLTVQKGAIKIDNVNVEESKDASQSVAKSPFYLSNISKIKYRESYGRNSGKQLLDLLISDDKSKRQAQIKEKQKQRQEQMEKQQEQREKQRSRRLKQYLSKQEQRQRRKSQKNEGKNGKPPLQTQVNQQIQNIGVQEPIDLSQPIKTQAHKIQQSKPVEIKNSTTIAPKGIVDPKPQPKPMQIQSISLPKSMQMLPKIQQKVVPKNKDKNKRVTINVRGNIKRPNDSVSIDFDFILPPQLRQNNEDSEGPKEQRPVTIQQNAAEQQQNHPKRQHNGQPMDIIQPKKSKDKNNILKNKKSVSRERQPQKRTKSKIDMKKDIKQNKNPSKESSQQIPTEQEHISKKDSKRTLTRTQASQIRKKEQKKRQNTHTQARDSSQDEGKRTTRRRINDLKIISQIRNDDDSEGIQRQKRVRRPPGPYWIVPKDAILSKNKQKEISVIDFKTFLRIIGLNDPAFPIQRNRVESTLHCLRSTLTLKPNQSLYSDGIDYNELRNIINTPQNYNRLIVSCQKSNVVKIKIDDYDTQYLSNQDLEIPYGSTFRIKNKSAQSHKIFVALWKKVQNE